MTRDYPSLGLALCVLLPVGVVGLQPTNAAADDSFYEPPGALVPKSGTGRVDEKVYEPGMRFPLEAGPAYPNSQVYGVGGYKGPPGSQCDAKNYDYPWHDNYCETRSWDMPLCPAGQGHQGQDIRAATCEKGVHWTVAAGAGTVTNIPENADEYATYIAGANGTRYDYLHGTGTQLGLGQKVARGDKVDRVSNEFGNTSTSIHTHFNLKQDVGGYGFVYVPPYMSLVESYKELMDLGGEAPIGSLEQSGCEALIGWAQDPDEPELSVTAQLFFDGQPSDPDNIGLEVSADIYRDDLCESLGSCSHGFAVEMPRSLRDGLEHTIYAYAEDDGNGPTAELEASPQSFTCGPPMIPEGVRRWIPDPETLAAWHLSPFWDMAKVGDDQLAAIPAGELLNSAPQLIQADDGSPEVFLVDFGYRRHVPTPEIAARWGLDLGAVEILPPGQVYSLELGPPLRSEPFMVKGSGPWIYLIDDPFWTPIEPDTDTGSTGGTSDSGAGGTSGSGSGGPGSGAASDADSSDQATGSSGTGGAGADGLDEDGCGCVSGERDPAPGSLVLAGLVLVGLRRRR